jgi:hypothetical protein
MKFIILLIVTIGIVSGEICTGVKLSEVEKSKYSFTGTFKYPKHFPDDPFPTTAKSLAGLKIAGIEKGIIKFYETEGIKSIISFKNYYSSNVVCRFDANGAEKKKKCLLEYISLDADSLTVRQLVFNYKYNAIDCKGQLERTLDEQLTCRVEYLDSYY